MMDMNKVKPDQWSDMSFDQLMEQKSVMLDRYEFFISKGYKEPAALIVQGIEKIDAIIFSR